MTILGIGREVDVARVYQRLKRKKIKPRRAGQGSDSASLADF